MRIALFAAVEEKLRDNQDLVNASLIGVIVVSIFLLLQPNLVLRTAGALWLILP